ncbi:hypothetical protein [Pleionea sp. CnH1-48]|uniref:hypothetical protein n=1 Tax=Pleionea sp. CnH1-48 TaxID=2954494 RepID=UPI0020983B42|nr:hypothetical protein [Pleionea sp. CnH1-48]MCO7225374.1 hypothetical protein [Pleionea sp. CnH1-48]
MKLNNNKNVLITLMSSLLIISCTANEPPSYNDGEKFLPEPELIEISELTGNKSCQTNAECKSIGLGARPCGGPDKYLIYSQTATDVDALKEVVARYNKRKRQGNEKSGAVGICVVAPKPLTECIQNRCQSSAIANSTH